MSRWGGGAWGQRFLVTENHCVSQPCNIECKVVDIITKHYIVILEGIAVHVDHHRTETRALHAVGDGTFIVDGERINKREMMKSKLPPGV